MTQACINTAQRQLVVEGVDIKALFLYNAAYNYISLAPARLAKAVYSLHIMDAGFRYVFSKGCYRLL
jgi:NADH:ubiquinone oxidoreductase subunit 3 (subunit A)